MSNEWKHILLNDLREYKNNLLAKKISRGLLIAVILGAIIPRDVHSFLRLISGTSEALFASSELTSLMAMLAFNVALIFSYLIQSKILPLAYHSNYLPSVFTGLSFAIARTLFFVLTNWFVLAWVIGGLVLSPVAFSGLVVIKTLFVALNIAFGLALLHEKRYSMLPVLLLQLATYAYFGDWAIIAVLNTLLLLFIMSKLYDIHFNARKLRLINKLTGALQQNFYHNFIAGPQTLRLAIMLRGNLLTATGILCVFLALYLVFYQSLSSTTEMAARTVYLYSLFVVYLFSFVYAKLKLEREKYEVFIHSIASKASQVSHDFLFTLMVFELALVPSLYFLPLQFSWANLVPQSLLAIPVLAMFSFLSTRDSRYRKIYLFVALCLMIGLILWSF